MKESTIDYMLRTTWQAVARLYNEEASKFDATMATGFALLSLDKEQGMPSTTLAPRLGMEATSFTRTIKALEEKGLIYRQPNPKDGRGILIYLTENGKQKRAQSKETVLKFNETIKKNISEKKLQHFREVIETINELILEKKIF
jgi:MarR family transcriptional regulator, organic hydroperoxide resistance regulator